jgi:hypothetical protein
MISTLHYSTTHGALTDDCVRAQLGEGPKGNTVRLTDESCTYDMLQKVWIRTLRVCIYTFMYVHARVCRNFHVWACMSVYAFATHSCMHLQECRNMCVNAGMYDGQAHGWDSYMNYLTHMYTRTFTCIDVHMYMSKCIHVLCMHVLYIYKCKCTHASKHTCILAYT